MINKKSKVEQYANDNIVDNRESSRKTSIRFVTRTVQLPELTPTPPPDDTPEAHLLTLETARLEVTLTYPYLPADEIFQIVTITGVLTLFWERGEVKQC